MEETSSPAPKRRRRNPVRSSIIQPVPVRSSIQPVPVRSRSIQILSEPEESKICQKKSQSDNQLFKSEIESGMSSSYQVQPVPVYSRSIQNMSDQSCLNDEAVSESLSTLGEPDHSGTFQIRPDFQTTRQELEPEISTSLQFQSVSQIVQPEVFHLSKSSIQKSVASTSVKKPPALSSSETRLSSPENSRFWEIVESSSQKSRSPEPVLSSSESQQSMTREPETVGRLKLVLVSSENARKRKLEKELFKRPSGVETDGLVSEESRSEQNLANTDGDLGQELLTKSKPVQSSSEQNLANIEVLSSTEHSRNGELGRELLTKSKPVQSRSEQNLASCEVQSSTEHCRNGELGQELLAKSSEQESVQFDSESSRMRQKQPEITRTSARDQSEPSDLESVSSERESEPSDYVSVSSKHESVSSERESEPSEQVSVSSERKSEPSEIESVSSESVKSISEPSELESVSSEQEPASSESVQSTSELSRIIERQPELTRTVSSTVQPFTTVEEHSRNHQQQLSSRCSLESESAAQYSVKHFRKQQLSRFSLPDQSLESESIQTSFVEDARKQHLSRFSMPVQSMESESVQTTSVVEHSRSSVPDSESGEGSSGLVKSVFSNPRPGIKIQPNLTFG
jgi:hypothetical protein